MVLAVGSAPAAGRVPVVLEGHRGAVGNVGHERRRVVDAGARRAVDPIAVGVRDRRPVERHRLRGGIDVDALLARAVRLARAGVRGDAVILDAGRGPEAARPGRAQREGDVVGRREPVRVGGEAAELVAVIGPVAQRRQRDVGEGLVADVLKPELPGQRDEIGRRGIRRRREGGVRRHHARRPDIRDTRPWRRARPGARREAEAEAAIGRAERARPGVQDHRRIRGAGLHGRGPLRRRAREGERPGVRRGDHPVARLVVQLEDARHELGLLRA